ncbi:OmpA family protein [Paracoccus aestuariivivens]|uniref:OmpA family protein n=1 Tax=Paracoccus aestuariivivens TaxID=1820333 RepID=A0A6L6J6B1_9RHOB|nr:OmpA family protein [Paracoccus aestuariivivens]MTH77653.1 OmpA family protein [Paracoccus aestuariivivens]
MANPKPRRGLAVVTSIIALVAAGGLSYLAAEAATDFLGNRSEAEVSEALHLGGYDFANVEADGLIVRLSGTAPDEVQRFRAKSQAENVIGADRVVDNMQVATRASIGTPTFEVELLRNDQGISVVGLVPASLDRNAMVTTLQGVTTESKVSDLVETADYPEPEGWDAAFDFGLEAAQLAKRAKISIEPGKVSIRAITDSDAEKAALEAALHRAKPKNVTLQAEITAPRPVITPFTLRFVKDEHGARFDACSADSEAGLKRIVDVGVKAGIPGQPPCRLGLGAPTSHWSEAAVPAIEAVAAMGAGSVTISNTDIALYAPASVNADVFNEAVGRLDGALSPLFKLTTRHEKKAGEQDEPARFSAILDRSGVTLRGAVTDERMRNAVDSLARSRFSKVDNALSVDDSMPSGWTMRMIAAMEALAALESGVVHVTPDLIRLEGISGNQSASDLLAARLSQRLGAGAHYELSVRYDRRLDPLVKIPGGVECVDGLNAAMHESEIGFEPSKSVIAGDPQPTLERLATIMAECGDYRLEVGGHTDSQGSEDLNAELSRTRALAVLDAMKEHGIDITNMVAKGYGESRPIAGNDTEEGREANRRIEFTLLSDEPLTKEEVAPATNVSGVTDSVEATEARTAQATAAAATGALPVALGDDAPKADQPTASDAIDPDAPPVTVTDPVVLEKLIEALTVPALEAAFPDNSEGVMGPEGQSETDGAATTKE